MSITNLQEEEEEEEEDDDEVDVEVAGVHEGIGSCSCLTKTAQFMVQMKSKF